MRLWEAALAAETPEATEWAFQAYFLEPTNATFFPKPGEIRFYVEKYHERLAQLDRDAEQRAYLEENRKAREYWKTPEGQAEMEKLVAKAKKVAE